MTRRRRAVEWRDEVLLYLHRQGLSAATSPSPSEESAIPLIGKSGLVTGLPWTLMVRLPHAQLNPSTMASQASDLADYMGTRSYAAVVHRRGYGLGSAYAITTLDVVAAAIKRETATVGEQP